RQAVASATEEPAGACPIIPITKNASMRNSQRLENRLCIRESFTAMDGKSLSSYGCESNNFGPLRVLFHKGGCTRYMKRPYPKARGFAQTFQAEESRPFSDLILPPTITATARPRTVCPCQGQLRLFDSN